MLKKLIVAFKMSFSMFTVFSLPTKDWNESSRKYMLSFLPFVGFYIGLLWTIFTALLFNIQLSQLYFIKPLLFFVFPFVATGFIHLDGFLDVCDSISCFANREKKIAILKDSRVGAFGVIYAILLFMFNYLVAFSMQNQNIIFKDGIILSFHTPILFVLLFIPFFSRLVSCFLLNIFKKIDISEYNCVNNTLSAYYIFLLLAGFMIVTFIDTKLMVIFLLEILISSVCFVICNKIYEGVNGDVSGFAITISESVALFTALIVL